MMDETTAPTRFRTSREDRTIPLFLALLLVASVPLWWWMAGPSYRLWAVGLGLMALTGATWALARWQAARQRIFWDAEGDRLEFRRGKHVRWVALEALTRIDVKPSAVRTRLEAGALRFRLSHRLVRVEALLDRLRARRPDLVPSPGDQFRFRVSGVEVLLTLGLALAVATTGLLVGARSPLVGSLFALGTAVVLVRALVFLPRSYTVSTGRLVVRYWVRHKSWGRPLAVREGAYAAAGALFFRLRFVYRNRVVVIDEGHLLDPLRPQADWVVHQLLGAPGP